MRFAYRAFLLLIVAVLVTGAQARNPIDRITAADLKADLFTLAGDAMRGREAGTIDELNASMWIAERCRAIGLQPAGDNGTYFQFFPIDRFRVSASSPVTLGGKNLRMGTDVVVDNIVLADVDAPIVMVPDGAIQNVDITGKTLVVQYVRPAAAAPLPNQSSPNMASGLRTWARGIQRAAQDKKPAAIVVLVPDSEQDQWNRTVYTFPRGTYTLDVDGNAPARTPTRGIPLLYVRESALGPMPADARLVASIFTDSFQVPSVNIIAKVP